MVGMWKAFDEIERIGWIARQRRPRMVSVQAANCAPIVRAFETGRREGASRGSRRRRSRTACACRVRSADFLILRAVRESGGTALAVSDEAMVGGMLAIGQTSRDQRAPGGGAAMAAVQRLVAARRHQAR